MSAPTGQRERDSGEREREQREGERERERERERESVLPSRGALKTPGQHGRTKRPETTSTHHYKRAAFTCVINVAAQPTVGLQSNALNQHDYPDASPERFTLRLTLIHPEVTHTP